MGAWQVQDLPYEVSITSSTPNTSSYTANSAVALRRNSILVGSWTVVSSNCAARRSRKFALGEGGKSASSSSISVFASSMTVSAAGNVVFPSTTFLSRLHLYVWQKRG